MALAEIVGAILVSLVLVLFSVLYLLPEENAQPLANRASSENLSLMDPLTLDENSFTQHEQLHRACFLGNLTAVNFILKDTKSSALSTLLAPLGLGRSQLEKHSSLLGYTPLIIACRQNNPDVVRVLLHYGAMILQKSKDLSTSPFHIACQEGNIDIVRLILESPKREFIQSQLLEFRVDDKTPLLCAVEHGQLNIIQLLIAYGADPTAVTHNRQNALHICKSASISAYLIQAVVYRKVPLSEFINQRDSFGDSPLVLAATSNSVKLTSVLLRHDAKVTLFGIRSPLHIAAKLANSELCTLLLQNGAAQLVNSLDFQNMSPLVHAMSGHVAIEDAERCVEALLLHGARFLCNGKYPCLDYPRLLKWIRRFPIAAVIPDVDGTTVFHVACDSGDLEIVEVLIKQPGSLFIQNTKGTPLHFSLHSCHFNIARLLLFENSSIANIKNQEGILPIFKITGSNLGINPRVQDFDTMFELLCRSTNDKKIVLDTCEYLVMCWRDVVEELSNLKLVLSIVNNIMLHQNDKLPDEPMSIWLENIRKVRNFVLFEWVLRETGYINGLFLVDLVNNVRKFL
ncbi:hypothetical protein HK096_008605 [Nowakowskiella sp. JEL0078]|nr:hypothetical protein HK096_008605 [Nowakowskiella sp. JEL0078]